MQFGIITILLDATAQDELLLDYSYALIKDNKAHLHITWVDSAPNHNFAANQGLHADLSRILVNKNIHQKQNLEQHVAVFLNNWCMSNNIDKNHVNVSFESRIGELYEQVAHAGRLGDYLLASCSQWGISKEIESQIHAALSGTARPVILLPKDCMVKTCDNIAIAWNDSKEAAEAVKDALPLIQQAKNVYIYTAPSERTMEDSSDELAQYLKYHGVGAVIRVLRRGKHKVSNVVLQQATQDGVDLMVMGASTSRILGRLAFGGMTKQMLSHSKIPLFMVG